MTDTSGRSCAGDQTPIREVGGSREPRWSKGRRTSRPGWAGLVIKPKLLWQTPPTSPLRQQPGTKLCYACSERGRILFRSARSMAKWRSSLLISSPKTRFTGATKCANDFRCSDVEDSSYTRTRDIGAPSRKASWNVRRLRFALAYLDCGRRWACSGPAGSATEGISSTWDPVRRGCAPLSCYQETSPVRRQPLLRPPTLRSHGPYAVTDRRYCNGSLSRRFFTSFAYFRCASFRTLQRHSEGAHINQHPRWFAPAGREFTCPVGHSRQAGSRDVRVPLPDRLPSRPTCRLPGVSSFRAMMAVRALLLRPDLLAGSATAGGPPRSDAHRTLARIGRATCQVSRLGPAGFGSWWHVSLLRKQAGTRLSTRPRASLLFDTWGGTQPPTGRAAAAGRARIKAVARGELAALLHVPGWLAWSRIRRTPLNYASHTSKGTDLAAARTRVPDGDHGSSHTGTAVVLGHHSGGGPRCLPVGGHHDARVRAVARIGRRAVAGQECGSLTAGCKGELSAVFASPAIPWANAARAGKLSEDRPRHRDEVGADLELHVGAVGHFMAASRRSADGSPIYHAKDVLPPRITGSSQLRGAR
jgi:hypothetical protein